MNSCIGDVRAAAARLLNASADNLALLRSTSEGVSLAANGIDWKPGDEVILYEREFIGAITPWLALADRGVKVVVIPDRGRYRFELEDVEALLSPRTRAICVSLVNNVTGFRAPIEAIGKLCAERG